MKTLLFSAIIAAVFEIASSAQAPVTQIERKEVFQNDDVVFHQIDEHTTFSALLATCQKTGALMAKHGIKHLYPGHFFGKNAETKQRLDDMATSAGTCSPAG